MLSRVQFPDFQVVNRAVVLGKTRGRHIGLQEIIFRKKVGAGAGELRERGSGRNVVPLLCHTNRPDGGYTTW